MGLHAQFDTWFANREQIEDEIERLIGLLDLHDGDCDLEDDDPAGDPIEIHGEAPADNGNDLMPILPLYALDQSGGPINVREGYRAWQRSLR